MQAVSDYIDMTQQGIQLRRSPCVERKLILRDESSDSSLNVEEDDSDEVKKEDVASTGKQLSVAEVGPEQSSSVSLYPTSLSHFQDSKVTLDIKSDKNRAWLRAAGLLDFAMLPWEGWKCNGQALHQFKILQVQNLYLTNQVTLTVEFVSHVFRLPMEGDIKFDKAPSKAMEKEFGVPDNPRGYYVIKKISDAERRSQMEWFLEVFLMLIKSDYMSDKNYAYLHAIAKGKKIGWAHIFHQKLIERFRRQINAKCIKHLGWDLHWLPCLGALSI